MRSCFSLLICLLTWLPVFNAVAQTAKDSAEYYYSKASYVKALPFFKPWAEMVKNTNGERSAEYGMLLSKWGDAINRSGNTTDAESLLLKALDICRQTLPAQHPDMGTALFNLGVCYFKKGAYKESIPHIRRCLAIREKTLDPKDPEMAKTLNFLATGYAMTSEYENARKYYERTVELQREILGQTHKEVGNTCINLAAMWTRLGNYSRAEMYNLKAIEILRGPDGEEDFNLSSLYNNLGGLNYDMGYLNRAETYFTKGLVIREKYLGPDHEAVAGSWLNLGMVYDDQGRFDKSRNAFDRALNSYKKAYGEEHEEVGICYMNISSQLVSMNCFAKAIPYQKKTREIFTKTMGSDYSNMGKLYNQLGDLYKGMGNFAMAKKEYSNAFNQNLRLLGKDHPLTGESQHRLATCFFYARNLGKAEEAFRSSQQNFAHQISRYFPHLSENEKEKFIQRNRYQFEDFESFALYRYKTNPAISGLLYNEQLAMKGLLVNASKKMKERLRNSDDSVLRSRFNEWEKVQSTLARLASSADSSEKAEKQQLEVEAEKMEKELGRMSASFVSLAEKRQIRWTDVQKQLKPGDVAIELVRIYKHGKKPPVIDTTDPKRQTYSTLGLTDKISYVALLVKAGMSHPEMVEIENGNDLEDHWIQWYKNCINRKLPDRESYNRYWKPIEQRLGKGVKRIFISPDGIYHSINLNTLQNPATGKYLLEERDIRLLTNTREIALNESPMSNLPVACLVGYPDYNVDKERRAETLRRGRNLTTDSYTLVTRNDVFAELPGTKKEVESISSVMKANGWQVDSYIGETALEDKIKETRKPRVMHIATHGFFQPDSTPGSNPLIHSGLLLTGANKTLAGERDEMVEDGILTAYEAMNLNLDNTDLVVLSACETGLGEIKNGEGVYGLQRAFKVAGAKALIMSLWKVDDDATNELMMRFYKNWLSPTQPPQGGGANALKSPIRGDVVVPGGLRSAFLAAQKELKAKYPDPYYWGAFVMVGE